MSKKLTKLDPQDFQLESFANLVSSKLPIVAEDVGTFEVFRSGTLGSLVPLTPYECVIAENLIAIEWELFQQRRMREASLRATGRKSIETTVVSHLKEKHEAEQDRLWYEQISIGGDGANWEEDEAFDNDLALDAAEVLAARALSSQIEIRNKAYEQITSPGLEPIDLMALAYRDHSNQAHVHDQKIQNLERRRREVQRDPDDLQRARPIEGDPVDL